MAPGARAAARRAGHPGRGRRTGRDRPPALSRRRLPRDAAPVPGRRGGAEGPASPARRNGVALRPRHPTGALLLPHPPTGRPLPRSHALPARALSRASVLALRVPTVRGWAAAVHRDDVRAVRDEAGARHDPFALEPGPPGTGGDARAARRVREPAARHATGADRTPVVPRRVG